MKLNKGFSLVELLVVVAVVAVLAAIAYPSYTEQAKRGRRADGKAFMMDIASRQERFYTQYSSYTRAHVQGAANCAGVACGLNYEDTFSPDEHYTAEITTPGNANCAPEQDPPDPCVQYTITLTAQFDDTKCATLTYTSTGEEGSTGGGGVDYCWR